MNEEVLVSLLQNQNQILSMLVNSRNESGIIQKQSMTFKEYAQVFIESHKGIIRTSSLNNYKWSLRKHILPEFEEYRLDSIESKQLQEFANKNIKKYAKKTVREWVNLVKNILSCAAHEGLIEEKKYRVKYPKEESTEYKVYSDKEYELLHDYVMVHKTSIDTAILIAMETGMRIGEVCGLKWGEIDFESGLLTVKETVQRSYDTETGTTRVIKGKTKTSSGNRKIPISNELIKELEIRKLDAEYYVSTGRITPNEPRNLRQAYTRRLKKLEIEHHTFHCLRHTFATRAISKGIDPKTVALLMGHKNCDITLNVYTSVTDEMKQNAINIINKNSNEEAEAKLKEMEGKDAGGI